MVSVRYLESLKIPEPFIFNKQEQLSFQLLQTMGFMLRAGKYFFADIKTWLPSLAGNCVNFANNWKFCFNKVLGQNMSAFISAQSVWNNI